MNYEKTLTKIVDNNAIWKNESKSFRNKINKVIKVIKIIKMIRNKIVRKNKNEIIEDEIIEKIKKEMLGILPKEEKEFKRMLATVKVKQEPIPQIVSISFATVSIILAIGKYGDDSLGLLVVMITIITVWLLFLIYNTFKCSKLNKKLTCIEIAVDEVLLEIANQQ